MKIKSQLVVISIRLRLFVYLPLSKNFCIATVIPIPETAIRIQPVVAFQINPECKISALATIMHTKKRRQSDYNDNQNVECGSRDMDSIVGFLYSPLGFLAFAFNLTKKIAEKCCSKFNCQLLHFFRNDRFALSYRVGQIFNFCSQLIYIVIQAGKFLGIYIE